MARTTRTPQNVTLSGLAPTYTAPALGSNNGIQFANDGSTTIRVKNASGTGTVPVTLTFDAVGYVAGIAISDQTVTCANDDVVREYGPFPPEVFGGSVGVDFDAQGTPVITVAVVRQPRA